MGDKLSAEMANSVSSWWRVFRNYCPCHETPGSSICCVGSWTDRVQMFCWLCIVLSMPACTHFCCHIFPTVTQQETLLLCLHSLFQYGSALFYVSCYVSCCYLVVVVREWSTDTWTVPWPRNGERGEKESECWKWARFTLRVIALRNILINYSPASLHSAHESRKLPPISSYI